MDNPFTHMLLEHRTAVSMPVGLRIGKVLVPTIKAVVSLFWRRSFAESIRWDTGGLSFLLPSRLCLGRRLGVVGLTSVLSWHS
jgi:hypothetical protein